MYAIPEVSCASLGPDRLTLAHEVSGGPESYATLHENLAWNELGCCAGSPPSRLAVLTSSSRLDGVARMRSVWHSPCHAALQDDSPAGSTVPCVTPHGGVAPMLVELVKKVVRLGLQKHIAEHRPVRALSGIS